VFYSVSFRHDFKTYVPKNSGSDNETYWIMKHIGNKLNNITIIFLALIDITKINTRTNQVHEICFTSKSANTFVRLVFIPSFGPRVHTVMLI